MKINKFIFLFLFVAVSHNGYTQIQAENIDWKKKGDSLIVTYDLPANISDTLEISLNFRQNGNPLYNVVPKSVKGTIGKGHFKGKGKRVAWAYKKDIGELLPGEYLFEVNIKNSTPPMATSIDPKTVLNITENKKVLDEIAANMIKVDGGAFQMGGKDYGPAHKVKVSSFSISKFEVTQKQWKTVMGENPSYHKDCDNCPVEQINYDDALRFINKLNVLTEKHYRLPTEAEWEFAARGGSKTLGYSYSGSRDINAVAWYADNANETHNVGLKQANELGLFDMTGNVWEWCKDWYDVNYYARSPQNDPHGAGSGSFRVIRGGSWNHFANNCLATFRNEDSADDRVNDYGLRLAEDK